MIAPSFLDQIRVPLCNVVPRRTIALPSDLSTPRGLNSLGACNPRTTANATRPLRRPTTQGSRTQHRRIRDLRTRDLRTLNIRSRALIAQNLGAQDLRSPPHQPAKLPRHWAIEPHRLPAHRVREPQL